MILYSKNGPEPVMGNRSLLFLSLFIIRIVNGLNLKLKLRLTTLAEGMI